MGPTPESINHHLSNNSCRRNSMKEYNWVSIFSGSKNGLETDLVEDKRRNPNQLTKKDVFVGVEMSLVSFINCRLSSLTHLFSPTAAHPHPNAVSHLHRLLHGEKTAFNVVPLVEDPLHHNSHSSSAPAVPEGSPPRAEHCPPRASVKARRHYQDRRPNSAAQDKERPPNSCPAKCAKMLETQAGNKISLRHTTATRQPRAMHSSSTRDQTASLFIIKPRTPYPRLQPSRNPLLRCTNRATDAAPSTHLHKPSQAIRLYLSRQIPLHKPSVPRERLPSLTSTSPRRLDVSIASTTKIQHSRCP